MFRQSRLRQRRSVDIILRNEAGHGLRVLLDRLLGQLKLLAGEAALAVMTEWVPDLVLTDMWMPKMDGTQLAEAMRKDRRFAEIPIVAVTADVDVGSTYDMSLFAKIISKPVTGAKLKALFGDIVAS